MKKTISAFLAALLFTGLLGGLMFLVGQDALGASTDRAAAAVTTANVSTDSFEQYEQIVIQYQSQEA